MVSQILVQNLTLEPLLLLRHILEVVFPLLSDVVAISATSVPELLSALLKTAPLTLAFWSKL